MKIVITTDTEYCFKLLSPEPLVQSRYVRRVSRKSVAPVAAMNQYVSAQNSQLFMMGMSIANDDYSQVDVDPLLNNPFNLAIASARRAARIIQRDGAS